MGQPLSFESARRRLESWKEIAHYLGVSVRTVQRWEEQSSLPVHRVKKDKGAGVFAYVDELDTWQQSRVVPMEDAAVSTEADAKEERTDPAGEIPVGRGWAWRWVWAGVLAVVLLAAGVAAVWAWQQTPVGPLRTERVTAMPGLEAQVDVSPTGGRIVDGWNLDGQQGIGIQDLASGASFRVTQGTVSEFSPQWSPDGKRVAFLRHSGGITAELMVYDGQQVYRVDSVTGPDWQDTFRAGPFLQWTAGGKTILVTGCVLRRSKCWVEELDLETRNRRNIVTVERPIFGLALAPDQSKLGLVLVEGRKTEISVVPLDSNLEASGRLEPLRPAQYPQFALNWFADGRAVFLQGLVTSTPSESGANVSEIRVQGRFGWRLLLTQHAGPNVSFDIAKDGRMYWSTVPFDTSMKIYRRESGSLGDAVCDSTSMERFPSITADGKRIAYVSNREGTTNIWVCELATQRAENVTQYADAGTWSPTWARDGKSLAFTVSEKGETARLAVWRPGEAARKITPTSFTVVNPSWDFDGEHIYFVAVSEGTRRLHSIRMDGTELRDLGETRASEVAVRRDGQMWLREGSELVLWNRATGRRSVIPVRGAELRGLDSDELGAFVTVKVGAGLYGLEAWIYREDRAPKRIAPAIVKVMGWHPGPNGDPFAVPHQAPEGDIYRTEAVLGR